VTSIRRRWPVPKGSSATRAARSRTATPAGLAFIKAVRERTQTPINVYDSATWSVILPLSEQSVANRSQAVDFPDFTRGKWRSRDPIGIVDL